MQNTQENEQIFVAKFSLPKIWFYMLGSSVYIYYKSKNYCLSIFGYNYTKFLKVSKKHINIIYTNSYSVQFSFTSSKIDISNLLKIKHSNLIHFDNF